MNEILIAIIGIIGTVTSGVLSWFFGRKKSNAEVADMQLKYIQKMDNYYNDKIDTLIEENKKITLDLSQLKLLVRTLIDKSCTDKECLKRQLFPIENISNMLFDTYKVKK